MSDVLTSDSIYLSQVWSMKNNTARRQWFDLIEQVAVVSGIEQICQHTVQTESADGTGGVSGDSIGCRIGRVRLHVLADFRMQYQLMRQQTTLIFHSIHDNIWRWYSGNDVHWCSNVTRFVGCLTWVFRQLIRVMKTCPSPETRNRRPDFLENGTLKFGIWDAVYSVGYRRLTHHV